MGSARPPFEYLISSSQASLESYELSRLNAVANLRKELRQIVDEWVEAEIEARMARWILDRRRLESSEPASPLPMLPHADTATRPSVEALPPLSDGADSQSPGSEMSCAKCASLLVRTGRSRRKAPLPRNRQLSFGAQAVLCRPARGSSYLADGPELESDPNSVAAVAALQSLERVVHTGAKVLQCELGEPGNVRDPEPNGGALELPLPGFSARETRPPASAPTPAGNVLPLGRNWQASRVLSALAATSHRRDKANADLAHHASASKPGPGKKLRAPFGPIPLHLQRIAVAS